MDGSHGGGPEPTPDTPTENETRADHAPATETLSSATPKPTLTKQLTNTFVKTCNSCGRFDLQPRPEIHPETGDGGGQNRPQRRLRHQPTPFTAELNQLIAQCVGRQSAAPAVYVMDLGFSQGEGTVVFVDPQEGDVTRTPSRNSRCKYVMEVKLKMQRR